MFERALEKETATLGPTHPEILNTTVQLGMALAFANRHEEGLPMLEKGVEWSLTLHGPGDWFTNHAASRLVEVYQNLQRYEDAVTFLRRLRQEQTAKLGPGHRATLQTTSLLSFAVLLTTGGTANKAAEPMALGEEALKGFEATVGPDDPDTLFAMEHLAQPTRGESNRTRRSRFYERLVKVMKVRVGPDHPRTLEIMASLANTLRTRPERLPEFIDILEHLAEKTQAAEGQDSPTTLVALHQLAEAYDRAFLWDKAAEVAAKVVTGWKATRGRDHSDTLSALNRLANYLRRAGRWADAVPVEAEQLEIRTAKIGPGPPGHPHGGTPGRFTEIEFRPSEGSHWAFRAIAGKATGGVWSRSWGHPDYHVLTRAGVLFHRPVRRRQPIAPELLTLHEKKTERESRRYADALTLLGMNRLARAVWGTGVGPPGGGAAVREHNCLRSGSVAGPEPARGRPRRSGDGGRGRTAAGRWLRNCMRKEAAKIPAPWKWYLQAAGHRVVQFYETTGPPEKAWEWRQKLPKELAPPPRPAARP